MVNETEAQALNGLSEMLAENEKMEARQILEDTNTMVNQSQIMAHKAMRQTGSVEKASTSIEGMINTIQQNAGADQVNNTMKQLNGIAPRNTAPSKEMATKSEEFAGQAEQLKDMIDYFKLSEN